MVRRSKRHQRDAVSLDDGTGQCLIDPRGAEVFPGARDVWYGASGVAGGDAFRTAADCSAGWPTLFVADKYRYTEYRLQPHEPLYAIGAFRSLGGVGVERPGRAR